MSVSLICHTCFSQSCVVAVAYLFRGSQTVLAQAIVGAAVATMLTGVQDTTTFAVVACLIAVLLVATSRATPSVRGSLFTDVRIMELCLLISLCLCLMAVPWQGALAAAATMLALAAFALPAVRAKAPVFLPSASADSQGLTLQVRRPPVPLLTTPYDEHML